MCVFGIGAAIGSALGIGGAAAGATAAGATAGAATAGAATIGSTLSTLGTLVSVGGALYQANAAAKAGREQARQIEEQKKTEARLTATEDQRTRQQFRTAMRRQFAELAARGLNLDSPTVIALGQSAAKELSFASQSVRSKGDATQRELSGTQRVALARAQTSVLKGTFSAASTLLNEAPDIWPELAA